MNSSTSAVPTVATLRTTGAQVHYEVRGHGPTVLLIGCPMDATAFAPLADASPTITP